MRSGFVRASELYDVDSRTPIAHPAHQATDTDVRRALEDREICTDGGQPLSGTDRLVLDVVVRENTRSETLSDFESLLREQFGAVYDDVECNVQTATEREDGGSR